MGQWVNFLWQMCHKCVTCVLALLEIYDTDLIRSMYTSHIVPQSDRNQPNVASRIRPRSGISWHICDDVIFCKNYRCLFNHISKLLFQLQVKACIQSYIQYGNQIEIIPCSMWDLRLRWIRCLNPILKWNISRSVTSWVNRLSFESPRASSFLGLRLVKARHKNLLPFLSRSNSTLWSGLVGMLGRSL